MRLLSRLAEPALWTENEQWSGMPPTHATVNSPELLMRLTCSGAGITALDDIYAAPRVQSGALVRVLP